MNWRRLTYYLVNKDNTKNAENVEDQEMKNRVEVKKLEGRTRKVQVED